MSTKYSTNQKTVNKFQDESSPDKSGQAPINRDKQDGPKLIADG